MDAPPFPSDPSSGIPCKTFCSIAFERSCKHDSRALSPGESHTKRARKDDAVADRHADVLRLAFESRIQVCAVVWERDRADHQHLRSASAESTPVVFAPQSSALAVLRRVETCCKPEVGCEEQDKTSADIVVCTTDRVPALAIALAVQLLRCCHRVNLVGTIAPGGGKTHVSPRHRREDDLGGYP